MNDFSIDLPSGTLMFSVETLMEKIWPVEGWV